MNGLFVISKDSLFNCRPKLLGAYGVRLENSRWLQVGALEETRQRQPVFVVGTATQMPCGAWVFAAAILAQC